VAAESGVGLFAGNDQEIAIGKAGTAFEVDALFLQTDLAGIGGMRIGVEIAERGDIDTNLIVKCRFVPRLAAYSQRLRLN
jgi:hypothetical protein